MTQRIQLDDLLQGVEPFQPSLMRMTDTEPLPTDEGELTHAAAKTAQDILKLKGLPEVDITDEDAQVAEEMFNQHIAGIPNAITTTKLNKPLTALKLEALVQEYDWRVIQHADQIRMLVTNKLLELSDHKDAKVQLKAVELLGKLADVGMFVEKQEITYKQQTDEEIQAKLREKLGLLIEGEVIGTTIVSKPEIDALNDIGTTPLAPTTSITTDSLLSMLEDHAE
jgi:hypothetical protein